MWLNLHLLQIHSWFLLFPRFVFCERLVDNIGYIQTTRRATYQTSDLLIGVCVWFPNKTNLSKALINSLAPERFEWNFSRVIFKLIDCWVISCEITVRLMSFDLTNDKSTLVQVMAWCRQATSHYLSQCWPRSMPSYGVTRPQWVNSSPPGQDDRHIQMHFHEWKFCILIRI